LFDRNGLWSQLLLIRVYVRKLKDAGFEEKQAEGVADAFRDA
jgi:hypothetical protein